MNDLQHLGITATRPRETFRFYNRVLRLPFISTAVNRGRWFDSIYRLEGAVNVLQWYQLRDEGVEFFHFPTHKPKTEKTPPLHAPGYRYFSLWVDGFDDYLERFERLGVPCRTADTGRTRCAMVSDPDGISVVLFENPDESGVTRVDMLGETGLTVTDFEGYDEYFDVLGLAPEVEGGDGYLEELFQLREPITTRRYGVIRLVRFPKRKTKKIERGLETFSGAEPRGYFPDPGVKHVCYYVDDIGSFYRRARKAGVCFQFPPTRIISGAKMSYFLDPEGNTIEAMQVPVFARLGIDLVGRLRQGQMELVDRLKKSRK